MKSIKPGRGPSMLGGFSGIFGTIFAIFWTIGAASIGAPPMFWLFGVGFTALMIGNTVYNFRNATGENRYSAYDITDGSEEPDPLNRRYGTTLNGEPVDGGGNGRDAGNGGDGWNHSHHADGAVRFCPYCGAKLGDGFAFCGKCGREIPKL
ncbi:MAG: zinc ribbon domain-containing protein [Oscillibacter sp.]|nr:zinc ribbon domain-containing protein [Oscillibacter sp.]